MSSAEIEEPVTPAPKRRSLKRIAFLGDAFTVGAGDETMLGWVGRVAKGEWGPRAMTSLPIISASAAHRRG